MCAQQLVPRPGSTQRIAHLAESFGLRAEVHGMGVVNQHLCMEIPNTTYYEALVWGNPTRTDESVDADGLVHAASGSGFADHGTTQPVPDKSMGGRATGVAAVRKRRVPGC